MTQKSAQAEPSLPAALGLENDRNYWLDRLSGFAPPRLPLDFAITDEVRSTAEIVPAALPNKIAERMLRVCKEKDTLVLAVLTAALKIVLRGYSLHDDVSVGTTIYESHRETSIYNEIVVLRSAIRSTMKVREVIALVQGTLAEAYEHQNFPFDELEHALDSRLFYTAITLEPINDPRRLAQSSSDMHFAFSREDQCISGYVIFNPRLFRRSTVQAVIECHRAVLLRLLENPDATIGEVCLVPESQVSAALRQVTSAPSPHRTSSVARLFEAQVEQNPAAVALIAPDRTVTYWELNAQANQLAHLLQESGMKPGLSVGILLNRSVEWIIAVLAVLKAGGTYVPLDPSYPNARLLEMVEEAHISLVLAKTPAVDRLICERVPLFYLNSEEMHRANSNTANLRVESQEHSLAYIMFSSGSTGHPKAIGIPHQAICRLVCETDYIQIGSSDRVAYCSNVAFDASTFEIWGALLNGAGLVLVTKDITLSPKQFATEILENQITILFVTTALFNTMATYAPEAFRSLEYLLFGGEVVDGQLVRKVFSRYRPRHLMHVYGPTENTTFSSWYEIQEISGRAKTIPIGRAIANSEMYLLDASLQPVPEGALGEIFVGGPGLAHGYISRPDLTAAAFIPSAFDGSLGARLYKTGDRGRIVSGQVEFAGRADDQVKIRGFRVEPEEIMVALKLHPGVRDSVVIARKDCSSLWSLAAYVVPEERATTSPRELRSFLKQKLPEYMVPASIVVLSSWPLNANGKIDRAALPEPSVGNVAVAASESAALTQTEEALIGMWKVLLGPGSVGIDDDFFEMGGHSLLATQFVSRVAEQFQVELPLQSVFETPTVRALAAVVDDLKKSGARLTEPPISVAPRRPYDETSSNL